MSIRVKLFLSYIATLVIPLFLILIAAGIILGVQLGSVQRVNNFGPDFLKDLPELAIKVSTEIDRMADTYPYRLEDYDYLREIDQKLKVINTGIAVRKGGKLIYSSQLVEDWGLFNKLPRFKGVGEHNYQVLEVNEKVFNIKQKDFRFEDGTYGSVFLLADFSGIGGFVIKYFLTLTWVALLILITTNGIVTFIVSRSIIKPLKVLKHSAEQIKDGNLDFKVNYKSKDETGEVCRAFEEMRVRLKESINLQMHYEENRKELISSISHDLKTPIASIKGYVEGIMDGVADSPEKMDRYLKTIYAKAGDMDRLIDDLFLFSKLDLKRLPFSFEKVDIVRYFKDCIEELGIDMEKKGIRMELNVDLDKENVIVLADREKLKRVVINIFSNSVKYMEEKEGNIRIDIKDSEDKVVIKIEDNGRGISREELPFIFDRFYRADPSRNTSKGGSGLGLAIAKQIIEAHGGNIWAESEYNKGTSIFFTLRKAMSNTGSPSNDITKNRSKGGETR